MFVVGAPPVAANGGTLTVVGTGTAGTTGTAAPVTQVFTPPQEIVLSSQPSQVFTPPAATTTRVYVTRPTGTYTPPARSGNLPFTGSNAVFGAIAGLALICGGVLLLLRRRGWVLQRVLDEQADALVELSRR